MLVLPTFETREVKFRGSTSSEDFNEMQKEIAQDLVNIFHKLDRTETTMNEIMANINIENQYLNNRIDNLENLVNSLNNSGSVLSNYSNPNAKLEHLNFFQDSYTSYGENITSGSTNLQNTVTIPNSFKAEINTDYNAVTLPKIRENNKTYLDNGSEVIVPEDLNWEVNFINGTGSNDYSDTNIKNAFDQNIKTTWKREVNKSNTDPVEVEIKIDLPKSIISKQKVNTIYINPFPSGGVEITDVQYKDMTASGFTSFNTFSPTSDSKNLQLSFSPKNIKSIKVKLKQANSFQRGNDNLFVLGAQNISVHYTEYGNVGEFWSKVEPGHQVDKIIDIDPIFQTIPESQQNSTVVEFDIYAENKSSGTLTQIAKDQNLSTNYNQKFWIKTTLKDGYADVSTPILKGLNFVYTKI